MTYAAPVTIAGFEMSGNTGNEVAVNATVNDVDLETATVTRGSGITATNLSNAFSANNFVIGGTKSDALTNNEYYEVSLQSKNGLSLSLDQITFNIRRSSTGPNAYQWQYSLDGFATPGVDIGAEGSYTDTATNGASMTPIDLTTEADLQKIPVGHTITFRLYAWGATGGPGTFAIGRQIGDDLAFVGTLGSGALASFEPQGLDGDEPSLAATTLSTDLNIALLDRGPGIGGSALNDGFSSNAYTIAGTKTDAINQGDYLQITLEAKDNYRASFSEILFNIRRSSTGPNAYQWQYSLDGFATLELILAQKDHTLEQKQMD
ncbi:MAG: hypothetical protein H6759_02685 [Candidatus Nomurabacteria bacterium]|nr:MAG: hypothetical protein H6759_02685 [Candidatus Nomurabacteria bacterium]